jgi:hypothetical protein
VAVAAACTAQREGARAHAPYPLAPLLQLKLKLCEQITDRGPQPVEGTLGTHGCASCIMQGWCLCLRNVEQRCRSSTCTAASASAMRPSMRVRGAARGAYVRERLVLLDSVRARARFRACCACVRIRVPRVCSVESPLRASRLVRPPATPALGCALSCACFARLLCASALRVCFARRWACRARRRGRAVLRAVGKHCGALRSLVLNELQSIRSVPH